MCGSSGALRLSACAWTNCPLHVPSLNPSKALATILGTLEHGTVVIPGNHTTHSDTHLSWLCSQTGSCTLRRSKVTKCGSSVSAFYTGHHNLLL